MLFLMCREFIEFPTFKSTIKECIQKGELPLRLNEIKPKNERSILNTIIPYELPLFEKNITDEIKIKNYGGFRRFLKDRRLDSLLPYFPEKDIPREKLRWELEHYENERVEIFRIISEFEKLCGNDTGFKLFIEKLLNERGFAEHNCLLKYFEIITEDNLSSLTNKCMK